MGLFELKQSKMLTYLVCTSHGVHQHFAVTSHYQCAEPLSTSSWFVVPSPLFSAQAAMHNPNELLNAVPNLPCAEQEILHDISLFRYLSVPRSDSNSKE